MIPTVIFKNFSLNPFTAVSDYSQNLKLVLCAITVEILKTYSMEI